MPLLGGLSIASPGWRPGKVPSEKQFSLRSLFWQLFMEVGRERFLLPIQGNLMSSLLQTGKTSPFCARKCFLSVCGEVGLVHCSDVFICGARD